MAAKAKKPATSSTSTTKVTRITARDDKPTVTKKPAAKKTVTKQPTAMKPATGVLAPFIALGGYFKGAWYELTQVNWPSRKATWSLTFALLGFTLFFVIVILLLDAGFQYLFELILG